MTELDEFRYPIGRFAASGSRQEQIEILRQLPDRLRTVVAGLNDAQLDTPYREGGWTVRQLVHHMGDSHAHAYIRLKLALTEDKPAIKTYDEAAWADLPDSKMPIDVSLAFTAAVHARMVSLFESMTDADYEKSFCHPERGSETMAKHLAIYAWHSQHHIAHITRLRERKGW